MTERRTRIGQWLDKCPWLPGVLTLAYVFFGLIVAVIAVYVPSIGDDMPRFFNFVSLVLMTGPIVLVVLQILNYKNNLSSMPRLAFLYLEIILMFGVIYFYAVSARKHNEENTLDKQKVIKGINSDWVIHLKDESFEDRNAIMKKALVCFHDSMHFSLITSTTVGYGDMVPASPMAKLVVDVQVLVSFFLIAFGVGYFFANQGKADKSRIKELEERLDSIEKKIKD